MKMVRRDVACNVSRRDRQPSIRRERRSELRLYNCVALSQAGLYRERRGV